MGVFGVDRATMVKTMALVGKIFFLLLISLAANAQKKNIPPGFEWIKKRNLLVAVNEVTCANWLKFIEASDRAAISLPEPGKLSNSCLYYRRGTEVFLRESDATYRDTTFIDAETGKKVRGIEKCANMPVTGISYEQALAYCDWLSETYADSKYYELKLNFRLATPAEMDSLLTDIYSMFKPGEDNYKAFQNGTNGHGCAIYNHLHNSWCDTNIRMKNEFGYGVPMQGGIFFPDANGLYDLMGNVAEMTSEKGKAKGGSCIDQAKDCQPGVINSYDGPSFWLGFRVVADLKAN